MVEEELLTDKDRAFLKRKGWDFEVKKDSGGLCIVIHNFKLSSRYTPNIVELLIYQDSSYPDTKLDCIFTIPSVVYSNGEAIPQTQGARSFLGSPWQQWSRHLEANDWRAGKDCIETFMCPIMKEILAE